MINEILFMQSRLFRLFCREHQMDPVEADRLFNACGVWEYIEEMYCLLHLNGDESALEDITVVIRKRGGAI